MTGIGALRSNCVPGEDAGTIALGGGLLRKDAGTIALGGGVLRRDAGTIALGDGLLRKDAGTIAFKSFATKLRMTS